MTKDPTRDEQRLHRGMADIVLTPTAEDLAEARADFLARLREHWSVGHGNRYLTADLAIDYECTLLRMAGVIPPGSDETTAARYRRMVALAHTRHLATVGPMQLLGEVDGGLAIDADAIAFLTEVEQVYAEKRSEHEARRRAETGR